MFDFSPCVCVGGCGGWGGCVCEFLIIFGYFVLFFGSQYDTVSCKGHKIS